MQISTISAEVAPAAVKPTRKNDDRNAFIAALRNLNDGEVLSITPDAGKSVRGVKTGLSRYANDASIDVTIWDADGNVFVSVNPQVEEGDDEDA